MQSHESTIANSKSKPDWSINWSQVVCGVVVGAILGIGATLVTTIDRIARLEGRQTELIKSNVGEDPQKKAADHSDTPKTETGKQSAVSPENLTTIIKEQQRANVKESIGESASESFTSEDLAQFDKSNALATIATQLKQNNRFIDVVLAVRQMKPSERQDLLTRCSQIARPTWTQLGKISPEGQTVAGQKAEKKIAAAIVDLVKNLVRLPDEEIKKLYT